MEYKLWLKAFTWKHEGEPSDPIIVQTDVRGPSAPRIANLTCHNADTLFLQWHRPSIYNKSIDLYYIYYRYIYSLIVQAQGCTHYCIMLSEGRMNGNLKNWPSQLLQIASITW